MIVILKTGNGDEDISKSKTHLSEIHIPFGIARGLYKRDTGDRVRAALIDG